LYQNELWLVTGTGTRRGLFGLQQLPEVSILTWAMGGIGQPPPTNFDNGLATGQTFVFAKCVNDQNCKWQLFQAASALRANQEHEMQNVSENSILSMILVRNIQIVILVLRHPNLAVGAVFPYYIMIPFLERIVLV